jgi:hypothetical protein
MKRSIQMEIHREYCLSKRMMTVTEILEISQEASARLMIVNDPGFGETGCFTPTLPWEHSRHVKLCAGRERMLSFNDHQANQETRER